MQVQPSVVSSNSSAQREAGTRLSISIEDGGLTEIECAVCEKELYKIQAVCTLRIVFIVAKIVFDVADFSAMSRFFASDSLYATAYALWVVNDAWMLALNVYFYRLISACVRDVKRVIRDGGAPQQRALRHLCTFSAHQDASRRDMENVRSYTRFYWTLSRAYALMVCAHCAYCAALVFVDFSLSDDLHAFPSLYYIQLTAQCVAFFLPVMLVVLCGALTSLVLVLFWLFVEAARALSRVAFAPCKVYCARRRAVRHARDARLLGTHNNEESVARALVFSAGDAMCGQECPICLQEYARGAKVLTFPCHTTHSFHFSCAYQWWHSNKSCPLCKTQFNVHEDVFLPRHTTTAIKFVVFAAVSDLVMSLRAMHRFLHNHNSFFFGYAHLVVHHMNCI